MHSSLATFAPTSNRRRWSSIFRNTGAALAVAALAMPVHAQSLTTAPPNNGSGGVFLNLTPAALALNITSFDTPFSSVAGTPVTVEVWTRPGTYVGFTTSNVGWTLSQTIVATSAGSATAAPVVLTTSLSIGAGATMGIYLHATTVGGGIRYTGTNAIPPQTNWSNADIALFSDTTRTGTVPFAGTQFIPRTFSGTVHYTVVPAPAALALLALAGLVGPRRRR